MYQNLEVDHEYQLTSITTNETLIENVPELKDEENVVLDSRIEEGHENVSIPIIESPKEAPVTKKHRGDKIGKGTCPCKRGSPYLILNKFGQPVGPTDEIVTEFSLFLGTVARNSELAPLNYVNWPSLPTHDKIWDYVQSKYLIPEEGRKWTLESVNYAWCKHKCRTKQKYFYAYNTDEERRVHRPKTLPETYFEDLLNYWNLPTTQEESDTNKRNRQQLEDIHTMGRKSFAVMRHKLVWR